MSAKIFMPLRCAKTAKHASELAGSSELRYAFQDFTQQRSGSSLTKRFDEREKQDVSPKILLQTLKQGQAVVIGSMDGKSAATTQFIMVQGHNWAAPLGD
jgi:hypothetical protein